jgi:xylulokinase
MTTPKSVVLGIDASTQSLSGVVLDCASGSLLWQHSLAYRDDARLCGLGFEHDSLLIPPREAGEAEQPPRLFIAALAALLHDLAASGVDVSTIAAINTSGQQHGHVYLNAEADAAFTRLREPASARGELAALLAGSFAYGGAPIWKTANTAAEAAHIRAAVGGQAALIARIGSDLPLRFAAAIQRKIGGRYPESYAATRHLVQISSLITAMLCGDAALPIDFGNACGTGLMNYRDRVWDELLLEAVAGDLPGGAAALAAKLPRIVHPLAVCGKVAAYFQANYGFSPACRVIAGSGDNPQSKVLAGGDLLSLGTSFVCMVASPEGGVDASGAANAMYDGLGRPFNFFCRTNGALAWDRLRQRHGLADGDYAAGEAALAATAAGSRLRFWHPDAESFPLIAANAQPVRLDRNDVTFASDFSAVVDSSLGLIYRYGEKVAGASGQKPPAIVVCGGASKSAGVMRRVAALWNRPAIAAGQAGAALGAALAAAVAIAPENRREALADTLRAQIFADKPVTLPDPGLVRAYHAPGAYLDQLEPAFEKLRAASS